MRITIKVEKVVQEIEKALQDYETEYAKLLKLYLEKLQKYTEYVKKQIEKPYKGELEYPPSKPSWLRDNFVQTLDALKAHINQTVEMDDREYNEIRSGIKRLKQDVTASINAMTALDY